MGEFTVINGDDFVFWEKEGSVNGAFDGVGDESRFCDGFHRGFGDFEHQGPVWTFFGVGGGGFGAVGELESRETG